MIGSRDVVNRVVASGKLSPEDGSKELDISVNQLRADMQATGYQVSQE